MPSGGEIAKKVPGQGLTLAQLQASLPIGMRRSVDQKVVDLINADLDDSELREEFRDNLISWANVLSEGKWKVTDFKNAVKFVTYRMTGDTMTMAWAKTFPERYQRLIDMGTPSKSIASHSGLYAQGKLVTKIMQRTLVPIYITNADVLQEAINVQATLMRTAKSETVMQKASATLIENLQVPEALKVQVDVGIGNDTVEDLRAITRRLAVQQQKMIQSGGMSAGQVAEMDVVKSREAKEAEEVIEAEYEEMQVKPASKFSAEHGFFPGSK